MEARYTWSQAPTHAVATQMACPTQSALSLVDNENCNGVQPASTSSPNCRARFFCQESTESSSGSNASHLLFLSLLLDASVQMPLHSVASHDASTQLPLTKFFIGCILSNDPLDRQNSPSAHFYADSASLPQPPDIATLCSPSSASHASDGHEHTTAPHVLLQPPPGLEKYGHLCASH